MSANKVMLIGGAAALYLFHTQIATALGFNATAVVPMSPTQPPATNPAVTGPAAANGPATGMYTPPPTNTIAAPAVITSPLTPLPITAETLARASWDPSTAALLGNNPAGMLSIDQWNYYRNQSGRPQITVDLFTGDRGQLVTALAYQQTVNDAIAAGTISSLSGVRGVRGTR